MNTQKQPAATQKPKQPQKPHGLQLMLERTFFYRDGMRSMIKANFFGAITVLVLVIALVVCIQQIMNPQTKYFGLTADNRIIQMFPLDEPNMTESALLDWAAKAATCFYVYDHVNYKSQLYQCQRYMTESQWDNWKAEMLKSKMIEMVKNDRLVVSAAVLSPPAIENKGILKGHLAWQIAVPLQVKFTNRQDSKSDSYLINMTVIRVNQLARPDTMGVAINSFVSSRYSGGN